MVASTAWPWSPSRRFVASQITTPDSTNSSAVSAKRRHALDLAVAVVMLLVGRPAGDAHGEIGHDGRAEIDQRMRRLGQNGERAGEHADHALGDRQAAGGQDRSERDSFFLVLHRCLKALNSAAPLSETDNATLSPTQSVLFAFRGPPKLRSTIGIIRKSAIQGAISSGGMIMARFASRGAWLALMLAVTLGWMRRPTRRAIRRRTSPSSCRSAPAPAWTCWFVCMPRSCRQALGKPVVIENKPGAATMLAAAQVATAPPDGHTLVVLTSAAMAINPALYKQINYSPENDFVPISLYVKSPFILVVNPNLPFKTVPEFINTPRRRTRRSTTPRWARARYSTCRWSSPSSASVSTRSTCHTATDRQSVTDMVAGHVDVGFVEAGASIPLIKDGKSARARGVVVAAAAAACRMFRRSRRPQRARISRRCRGTSCWRRRRRRRTSSIDCMPK